MIFNSLKNYLIFRVYNYYAIHFSSFRLGDSKETIREKSQFFLLKLMETESISVQYLFDRLASSGFNHKNANVREQCLKCLDATLVAHGTKALTISKLVPFIVKLLSDPHASVRDR